jgi:hypothetical protein
LGTFWLKIEQFWSFEEISIFFGIRFSTKVPNKWAIVKVGHNKGVVDCNA